MFERIHTIAVVTLLLAASLSAQLAELPNTGCQSPARLKVSGTPQLGQCVDFYPPDPIAPQSVGFFLVGLPQVSLTLPFGCQPGPCRLGVTPVVSFPSTVGTCLSICVPGDPTLVGGVVALQHLYVEIPISVPSVCGRLSVGYAMTVMP